MDLLCEQINASCQKCKELSGVIPYVFDIGLTPSTSYNMYASDKFGNSYLLAITTAIDGKYTFNGDVIFNKWAGPVKIWFTLPMSSVRVNLTISSINYTCIIFKTTCA